MRRENESFARRLAVRVGLVVVATAVYGAVLAAWRSPLMAAYVAAKLPVMFVASTLIVSVFCWMAGTADDFCQHGTREVKVHGTHCHLIG